MFINPEKFLLPHIKGQVGNCAFYMFTETLDLRSDVFPALPQQPAANSLGLQEERRHQVLN